MAKRKDGKATKQKLLDAACEVFAEKGFQGATVTEICRRAGANVAAVNYYFGDKDSLYVAAWRQAMRMFLDSVDQPPEDFPPEEQFRYIIHGFIRKMLSSDKDRSHMRRLELMELANPTGLINEAWQEEIAPRQKEMSDLIRQIMGPEATETTVQLCELSIVNQCRGYMVLPMENLDFLEGEQLTSERVEQIAEHTVQFSLAGIKAIHDLEKRRENEH